MEQRNDGMTVPHDRTVFKRPQSGRNPGYERGEEAV